VARVDWPSGRRERLDLAGLAELVATGQGAWPVVLAVTVAWVDSVAGLSAGAERAALPDRADRAVAAPTVATVATGVWAASGTSAPWVEPVARVVLPEPVASAG
jgi:hypothetical protein